MMERQLSVNQTNIITFPFYRYYEVIIILIFILLFDMGLIKSATRILLTEGLENGKKIVMSF